MFTVIEPSERHIKEFLAEQKDLPFSYKEVGASKSVVPQNYPINHHRIRVGSGVADYARAKNALQSWTMYKLDWTRIYPPDAPIAIGETVVVIVNHHFCWSMNSCRIVYVLEENEATERFGFAFGTLPGHSETGEERFTVEWNRDDDSVWYELLAFALPHHILAKIAAPFVHFVQRKFALDSQKAMQKAVGKSD
jgi:uncharacterized protein (UPF0548 family)